MDPPWQLATANPTRGVALGYSQLTDQDIVNLPVPKLQTNGFLFIWVINAKYKFTLDLFDKWGYRYDAASSTASKLETTALLYLFNIPFRVDMQKHCADNCCIYIQAGR